MTLNELKNDVASLGFEEYVEDENCFIASANRALSLIYTDRPVSKTIRISFVDFSTSNTTRTNLLLLQYNILLEKHFNLEMLFVVHLTKL